MTDNELRVFISGTFVDLTEEREHLTAHVFPEIRRLCRERGVTFTEVDLRWGITERQARRHKVVELCIDEIVRHTPYILLLAGDRYGWRPEPKDLGGDPRLLERYPWLMNAIVERRSLTEIEGLVTTARTPGMSDRVRLYFKHASDRIPSNATAGEREERELLAGFRARAHASGHPVRDGYRTPKGLGALVRADLLGILDAIAPESRGHDAYVARERRGHEAFAASRRRAYIEHERSLAALDAYVLGGSVRVGKTDRTKRTPRKKEESDAERIRPLVVTGESGAGKSALLAWWSHRHRERHPDDMVIEHYVGATSQSADRFGLLRRIMIEIRERTGAAEEPPVEPTAIVEELPAWLARLRGTRLVLVVDALNQLDRTADLAWLPRDVHADVRVILSTLDGPLLDACEERGYPTLTVRPLGKGDRRRAIRAYLGAFGKELPPAQTHRIAADAKSANPLYLRTSLEELRLFADHATIDERIGRYLAADDLEELYRTILERLEQDHGATLTRATMTAIWAARNGLSLEELCGILDTPPARLLPLLSALEYHLMRSEGLHRFHHDYLRGAVERRYLRSRGGQRSAHRRVAEWFAGEPASRRRATEELWGWKEVNDLERLAESLSYLPLFQVLNTEEHRFELLMLWRTLDSTDLCNEVVDNLNRQTESISDPVACARLRCDIAAFLSLAGEYQGALSTLRTTLHLLSSNRSDRLIQAEILDALGGALTETGAFAEAEEILEKAVTLKQKTYGAESLEYAATLEMVGMLKYQLRDLDAAEAALTQALAIHQHHRGEFDPQSASCAGALGAVYFQQRHYKEAKRLITLELSFHEARHGASHPLTAACHNNLGALSTQSGDHIAALDSFRKAQNAFETAYGKDHPYIASALMNLALSLQRLGQYREAEEHLRRAISIGEMTFGADHPSIATALTSLGTLLVSMKHYDEAISMHQRALAIRRGHFGSTHSLTLSSLVNIATATRELGALEEAARLYESALSTLTATLPSHEALAERIHNGLRLISERAENQTDLPTRRPLFIEKS